MKMIKNIMKYIMTTLCVVLAVALLYASYWSDITFGQVPFDQILFHLMVPLEGADNSLVLSYLKGTLLWIGIAMLVFYVPVVVECSSFSHRKEREQKEREQKESEQKESEQKEQGQKKKCINRVRKYVQVSRKFYVRHIVAFASIFLSFALVWDVIDFQIIDYVRYQLQTTNLYEKEYVDSKQAGVKFPEEKKNLIIIVMESMEATFADEESGGAMRENLIPNLTRLAKEHTHFSMNNQLQGAFQMPGTGWTIAGIMAQTAGIPMSLPIGQNSYGKYKDFMPGLTTMGELLEAQGYTNEFMIGSEAAFAGMGKYFETHGNYKIFDYDTAIERGYIDEDYYEFWGFEDMKLYEYAKLELETLAKEEQPFHMIINTIDTHTPTGYKCKECKRKFGNVYKNVIHCADRQVNRFVEWLEEQPFYEDTVVVIVGDHLSMSTRVEEYMKDSVGEEHIDDYERTAYNVIINSKLQTSYSKNRTFSTMDMYPTILASIGCEIPGERLGLGTNLYSGKKTLMEEMGAEAFKEELKKNSKFYNQTLVKGK